MKNLVFVFIVFSFTKVYAVGSIDSSANKKENQFSLYGGFNIGSQYFRLADESFLYGYPSGSKIINSTLNTTEMFSGIVEYNKLHLSLGINWAVSNVVYHVNNPIKQGVHYINDEGYERGVTYEVSAELLKSCFSYKSFEIDGGLGYYYVLQSNNQALKGTRILLKAKTKFNKKSRISVSFLLERRYPDFQNGSFANGKGSFDNIPLYFKHKLYYFFGINYKLK